MRVRMGPGYTLGIALSAAMLVGCSHTTPQEKAQQDQQTHAQAMQKQAQEEALAQQKAKDQGKPYADDKLEVIGYPYSQPENRQTLVDAQEQAMAVAGARFDATLYDADFDGGDLTAVGEGKVAMMLNNAPANRAMTIYIFAGSPENVMQARQASVDKMIHDPAYAGAQVTVKAGSNSALSTPALPGLAAIKRLNADQAITERAQSQRTGTGGNDTTTTGQ
jgi:hypothetical protein